MSSRQSSASTPNLLVRIAAGLVLFLTLTLCGLEAMVAMNTPEHPEVPVSLAATLVTPLMTLTAGIALAAMLDGIARLIGRPPVASGSSVNVEKLTAVVVQMNANLPALFDALRVSLQETLAVPGSVESAPVGSTTDAYLERMVKLLEEMKELSMLDDTQRQQRRTQVMDRRKLSRLEDAARLIHHQEWAQADSLLHLLESLHPGDPEVLARRNELDDARVQIQTQEWETLGGRVEDLMALSNYDEGIAVASHFLDRFPGHYDCQQLLERVQREKAVFIEGHANTMYESIRASVEGRQWRQALDGIQQFLEYYPDHPRAEKIRLQIRVIQKNAEIEERHDLEDRIRDSVANRRYTEAADLSEDLLNRFPESAQAAQLAELLPKLRERASAEVSGNVFLG